MEGYPGGMMNPMGPAMMMPPGMMGMDLPFPGPGLDARNRMWPNDMGLPNYGQGTHPSSREGSIFYKTRICNRYAEGNCTFGDRCNYAHGEAELRTLPMDGQKVLENKARMENRAGVSITSPADGSLKDLAKREVGGLPERSGVRSTAFKSRLCTRFMQKGECPYGPNCHFAHGHEDLQNMDRAAIGPADGPSFEMPFPAGGLMMPGGPMMPPDFMAMAMGGLGPGAMMPPRPRPPPGPPPTGPAPPDALVSPDGDDMLFDVTRTPTRTLSDVPYLDRVKAMCALLGVGTLRPKDVGRENIEAAISSLQTGDALQGNAYADALNF